MFSIRNNGAARDFKIDGKRYFMGRSVVKRTKDRDFAKAMNNQRHVVAQGLDNPDFMKIGELRHYAKGLGIEFERTDTAVKIRAKIHTADSQ